MKVTLSKKNVMGIPIFVTLDACHLMKLLRNCFGTYQVFKDDNGETVSWIYLEELNNLQEKEGLHLANKLRRRHILWNKDKMHTNLALQLFSNSVSNAIDYCRDTLKLKQFSGSGATTRFLRKFNDLFDVLNIKSKFGKKWSAPLVKDDSKHKEMFDDCFEYILALSLPNGKKLVDSPRCKTFVGLLSLMKSVSKIHEVYVNTGHLDYLLTFKMSQDHLEMYFSSIRASLGGNNNPTTTQFAAAYKKLLLGACNSTKFGIWTNQDDTVLLSLPPLPRDTKQAIDVVENSYDLTETEVQKIFFSSFKRSVFSAAVLVYISGFVQFKIVKKESCLSCADYLKNTTIRCTSSLINFVNCGRLTQPSTNLHNVVRITNSCLEEIMDSDKILNKKNILQKILARSSEISENIFKHIDVDIENLQSFNSTVIE